ncbi:MAG: ABC transporter ATP-binding protein [Treponema sp.]|jgi:simple sugar transport system ATP-binding protein|nr:ABC transporter ATP-binding protein [Treponema sp.]
MSNIIEMIGITKTFSGITANDNISLKLKKGEIHALLGENGAGKTTLMNILFGLYKCEKGIIKKNGKTVQINSPHDARKLGIGMVHQHFKLVHNFTVLENIILGEEPVKNCILSLESARNKIIELSGRYKFNIEPDAVVSDITVGMQQRVEILKMLYRDNDILIFDEPTAVLAPQEADELMRIMKNLAAEGKSILFITHKLNEIKTAANRCTVLRNGKFTGTVDVESISKEKLSEMMTGRNLNFIIEKTGKQPGEVILKVENLTYKSKTHNKAIVNNINFEVRANEIVCIAGIDGNGQQELIRLITGMLKPDSGSIDIKGKNIAHIPEDRQKYGLIMDYNIGYNMILQNYRTSKYKKFGFYLNIDAIYKNADALIEEFDIRAGQGARTITRSMSGGNQQKVVIAREIYRECNLLAAVQPTRGLDIGACEYIYRQLAAERDKGRGVLLVSFDLDEVMDISDRILVIYEGKIVANVKPKDVSYKELGLLMTGAATHNQEK